MIVIIICRWSSNNVPAGFFAAISYMGVLTTISPITISENKLLASNKHLECSPSGKILI